METTISERIRLYCANQGITARKFEQQCGLYNGFVKDVKKISAEKIQLICRGFPNLNISWLLNGDGTMLRTDGTLPPSCVHDYGDTYVGALISANDVGIPYYDIEPASCGSLSGFGEAFTANNIAAHIVLPNMTAKKGDIFIKTKGRSMVDYEHPELSIPDGAIVLIREWTESYIAWGELYCVMTRSGYAVKRLMPGHDTDHISCVSADSQHYPPYDVSVNDIVALARVIGILTYKTV